ncbi:unnamed protein product [Cylicostephanus goldi]|uniref:Uncharacterized protein n=1 Tax=Cylicostephanus goldi TaxID=71465 RepID=A0A3P7MP43_CYLGO|nr:unnamed protein product [Cylicostephanus goldi]
MPSEVRRLSAHVVLYCKPSNAPELWQKSRAGMLTDRCSMEDLKSLKFIKLIITANGTSMMDCGVEAVLELIEECGSTEIPGGEDNAFDTAIDSTEDNSQVNLLNAKQRVIVMKAVATAKSRDTDRNRLSFDVYGKEGCGKTFTSNTMIDELRNEGW